MFKTIGLPEIIIVLVIVLLVFGVGRIGQLGGELGKGIRAFKEGLSGKSEDDQSPEEQNNIEEDQS
jgi:sec-independent protein translocase protein TatA